MPPFPLTSRRFAIPGLLIACLAGGTPAAEAVPPPPEAAGLDQKSVHDDYLNGDFEKVLARIEAFRKGNPDHSRADSLFIARHLAVVLSADPRSQEAGKYWMHRLLLLSPQAGLAGMYASEAIERVFAKVKEEDEAAAGRRQRPWLWIGAGGTALAAGLAVWFAFLRPGEEPARTYVPVTL